jgi:hypothetical protein
VAYERVKTTYHDARTTERAIKMGLQEVGCGGMDWIDLAQDRDRWRVLVTGVMNIRCSIKMSGVS